MKSWNLLTLAGGDKECSAGIKPGHHHSLIKRVVSHRVGMGSLSVVTLLRHRQTHVELKIKTLFPPKISRLSRKLSNKLGLPLPTARESRLFLVYKRLWVAAFWRHHQASSRLPGLLKDKQCGRFSLYLHSTYLVAAVPQCIFAALPYRYSPKLKIYFSKSTKKCT